MKTFRNLKVHKCLFMGGDVGWTDLLVQLTFNRLSMSGVRRAGWVPGVGTFVSY